MQQVCRLCLDCPLSFTTILSATEDTFLCVEKDNLRNASMGNSDPNVISNITALYVDIIC